MRLEVRRPSGPPEDSIAMRVVVALRRRGRDRRGGGAAGPCRRRSRSPSLVLAPAGYWFSYRRRRSPNLLLKVALSVALLAALGQFLGDVAGSVSVDQARIPLASLFLWVQVLHAFDVPRRRDLAFSMVSSLILIAEAGSLSLSTSFLVFLLPWAALGGAWLSLSSRPRADQVTAPVAVRRYAAERAPSRTASIRSATAAAGLALLAASLVFLAMPRLPGGLRAHAAVLARGQPVAGRGLRRRGLEPGPAAQPGRRRRRLLLGRLPGVQRRGRPASAGPAVRRPRVPGAGAAAALWRAEAFDRYDAARLDDHRRRDRAAAERRRRPLRRGARRGRAAQHAPSAAARRGSCRRSTSRRPSPTCCSRPRAPGRSTSRRRDCGSTPAGRSARRSCSTRASCTRSCRRCRSTDARLLRGARRAATERAMAPVPAAARRRCRRGSGTSRPASRADGRPSTTR